MEMKDPESMEIIRESVRNRYGRIASNADQQSKAGGMTSCCATADALAGSKTGGCCGNGEMTPEKMSALLGYGLEDLAAVPEGANMGLGCGNPVALASLKNGDHVIDLGSGGGFDCFLAARQVGPSGRVVGVDMTPEMITKARRNAQKAGITNVAFRLGEIEHLPVADNFADIIISNCVINLSADKRQVFRDAFRALKPGGRLAISDIVATQSLPAEIRKNLELVSACVGGAVTIDGTLEMLKDAGFENIEIRPNEESRGIIGDYAPGTPIGQYVVAANIEARKPVQA